jgi:dihydrolipoamide dehydrogenase
MSEHFHIAVIGAGPGGYIAALRAAARGAKTVVIEKSHLGGTCLNWGCIPSKALLTSAELLHNIQHAKKWGLSVSGVSHDWTAIQKHKDKVIRQLRGGIGMLFKGRGVTHLSGAATLDGPGAIAVDDGKGTVRRITAEHIILATGSQPTRIPNWPDDPQIVCTSDEAVHWSSLPKRLLIVGGGVIGCEFACMLQPLGVEVVVVEMLPRLTPTLDAELGASLQIIFESRGITCLTDTKVSDLSIKNGQAVAVLSNGQTLTVDRVLVSVGRSPNTRNLGLQSVGITPSPRGFVTVDDHMRTAAKGVYCIGDANGRCLLAHAASAHGIAAVENILGKTQPFHAPIPSAVYTFPEIGSVGLSQQDCLGRNLPIAIGRFSIGTLGKAMAAQHADGFVKTIRHRETDEILGVHMIGHNATECIAAAATMMHTRATMHDLAEAVFAHPTISEAIKESAEDALALGLHQPPRKIIRVPAVVE